MKLLYQYSKPYWNLFAVALLLAATNQIFSLLDPVIFRHVIDGMPRSTTTSLKRNSSAGRDCCF